MKKLIRWLVAIPTVIAIFLLRRTKAGYFYLFRCPKCERHTVVRQWPDDPYPVCVASGCDCIMIKVI